MQHVMFDIDGTLVKSFDFDEQCYIAAVKEVTGFTLLGDWHNFPDITDRGILKTYIEASAPHFSLENLEGKVKRVFIRNLNNYLKANSVEEVNGAKIFMERLKSDKRYTVSLATGGWLESAMLKLDSAGIDVKGLPIASSNDHYKRTEIMTLARAACGDMGEHAVTYFGDGEWDVKACRELGMNLVIVGDRVSHHQSIPDFADIEAAERLIGV